MRRFLLAALACLALSTLCAQAPNTISGLQLWLDGADPAGSGTAPANGSAVTTWVDKSGNGRNAQSLTGGFYVNPVYTASAINGKGSITFTRTAVSRTGFTVPAFDLRAATNPDVTIFTVYVQGSQSGLGDQAIWGDDNGAWDRFFFSRLGSSTDGAVSRGMGAVPYDVPVPGAGISGAVRLLTTVYDGNVSGGVNNGTPGGTAVYFNGQLVTTTTDYTDPTDAQTSLRIGLDGDDNWFEGQIGEMIVYNRVLSACEIAQVNRYLSAKYGQNYNRPLVTLNGSAATCGTAYVTLSAPAASSYQWLMNGAPMIAVNTQNLGTSTPGNYQVITYASGCATGDTSIAVTVTNDLQASVNQPGNQSVCAGSSTAAVTFSGTLFPTYSWTNNNTSTGLAASGTGNIASFTATNATNAPITSTVTVTPVGAGLNGYAYVPNNGANSVSVINVATGATVATIPTAGEPYAVAVLPDHSKIFVSTVTGNRVEVITGSTNSINQNSPFNLPHGLVVSPDGSRVYVNGWESGGALSYIPTATPTTSTYMTAVANPEGMAVSPDGSKLYVASSTNPGKLTVVNTTTNAKTELTLGTNSFGVALTPDGRYVYVTNINSNTVSVVDAATFTLVTTITVGTNPLGVATSPDGTKVYVANSGSNTVSVISTATNTVSATINVGSYPFGVAVSADGSRVFVTNQNSNNLSVIDGSTNSVLTTYNTGTKPIGLGKFLDTDFTCNGTSKTFTITVNPQPSATISYSGSPFCATGTATPTITGTTGGTFSSTSGLVINGTTGVIDLAASTAGTYTVTYTIAAAGGCSQVQATTSVTVSLTGLVDQPGNQVVCDGSATTVTFTGTATNFTWTNSNPAIGLAASGSGNIAFSATNAGSTPQTATITVTPSSLGSQTFAYTGAAQTFVVPAGVTSIDIEAAGGAGATGTTGNYGGPGGVGGKGGLATGTLAVTPGQTLTIYVGGAAVGSTGGFNGGGNGANGSGGGGGASDVRAGGTALTDRVLVSGGGGGGGNGGDLGVYAGGAGGSGNGVSGVNGTNAPDGGGGGGGTLAAGGVAGIGCNVFAASPGGTGSAGVGGNGGTDGNCCFGALRANGGGGGGGFLGGGAGGAGGVGTPACLGNSKGGGGGGAGGSFYIGGVTGGSAQSDVQAGNGYVKISYSAQLCAGPAKTFTITVNPAPAATISYAGSPYCATGTATPTFSGTTGGTYSSSAGLIINGSTGVIDLAASTPGTYTVTYTVPAGNGCAQVQATTVIMINPNAQLDQPSGQVLCAGSNTAAVAFTGGSNGVTYSWTNNTPSIGLAASGTGDIGAFAAVNNGTTPVTATITVTPQGGVGSCTGSAKTFTITVNPKPVLNTLSNQTVCPGTTVAASNFGSTATGGTTTYTWTNNNPAIGLAAGGNGNTPAFNATNSGTSVQTATITVTPTFTNGGQGCTGTAGSYQLVVNPTPTVNAIASQNLCNGANSSAVTFSGSVSGTVYSWANNTPSIGLAASGNGNIASFAAVNSGTSPVTALVTVTPSYTNAGQTCSGTAASFSITVNPTPTVNTVADQTLCNGAGSLAVAFSGAVANTAFSWTNSNPSIGLAAAGTGNIASFVAVNNGTAPATATITVTPQATLNGRAYVPNNGSGTVSMVDLASGTVVGSPITVGANPFGVAVLPDRSQVFVTNTGGNSVSVISTATNTVTASSPYNQPHGIVAAPDGTRVYVNGWGGGGAVSYINVATPGTSQFLTAVTNPEGMAVSADGSRLYVASSTSPGKLVVLNTVSNTLVANVTVGDFPQGVALSADGSKVYVVNNGSGNVSVLSTASNSVTATIPVGSGPLGVAVSPDGTKAYVTNSGNNNVSVINTATNTVSGSITVGTYPYGVAVSPDGSRVFVANRNANSVSIIDAATNAVSSVAVGTAPIALGQFTTATLQCAGTPKTFTITVNPTPTVNPVADQTVCNGASIAAINFTGAVSGTVYNWANSNPAIGLASSGTGNIASFTATNSTSTVQSATITVTPVFTNGGQNCPGNPITFTITVNPTPTVTPPANQVLCNGGSAAAVSFSGPVSGTTFNWSNNTPSIGLAASGSGNIASFTATNNGTTPVTATITVTPLANTCPGTAQSFTITVNPTPTVSAITPVTVCAGLTATVQNFAGGVAGTVFNWTNSNPSIGLAASGSGNIAPFVTVNNGSTPAVANITVTPSYTNGGQTCAGAPVSFGITVNPLPTGTITAPNGTLICAGGTVPLQVTGGVSYQWFVGGNPIAGATGATYNAAAAGTYTVNITNSLGCTRAASNSITLTLVQKPTADFSFNSYCLNTPVQFTNSTSTVGAGTVTYQWTFGNGQGSTQQNPTATYGAVGPYTVTLVASPNGCTSLNDTARKTIVIEAPIPGQRLAPQDIVTGRPTEIHARNLANGHYSWTPTTGLSNPAIWYPVATLTQQQEYRIQVSFNSGCVTVDTLLVRIQKGDDIFVPTAFSPDGDGVNDVLHPITAGLSSLRLFTILDRMGREIYRSSGLSRGWDGTYKGQPAPPDTYTWVAEGRDSNGNLIRKSGQVVLVR